MIGYIKLTPEAQLFYLRDPVLSSLRDYFQEENQSGNDRPSIDLCGSLNENVPQSVMSKYLAPHLVNCLRMFLERSGGAALLEEVHGWGWVLRFHKSRPGPRVFLLTVDQDIKL